MEKLLLEIKKSGIRINVNGDNLRLKIPNNFDNASLLNEIKANKLAIIDFVEKSKGRKVKLEPIPTASNGPIELTPSQKRIYVLQELSKNSTAYNMPFGLEIVGNLDKDLLDQAFKALIKRHQSLHTSFVLDAEGNPVQILEKDYTFNLGYRKCKEDELAAIIRDFPQPFDLQKGPLFRAEMVELTSNRFILLIDLHHIIFDGFSFQIFTHDLQKLYQGEALIGPVVQYRDYAEWYHGEKYQQHLSTQKSFWEKELTGFTQEAVLPADFKKTNTISFEGEHAHFKINQARSKVLYDLKKKTNISLFTIFTALYSVFQYKLTGVNDLVIGTPVAGRRHPDLGKVIGMFVNTIAMRLMPKSADGFTDYLMQVGSKTIACFENQEYPYEDLIEDLGLRKGNELNPLFNTLIAFNNIQQESLQNNDLDIQPYDLNIPTSKFDLIMHVDASDKEFNCSFEYKTQLFKRETINRFFNFFCAIIDQVGEDQNIPLANISLLDKATEDQLVTLNDFTNVAFPDSLTAVQLFEDQVKKTPTNKALSIGNEYMSYEELNNRANQIATVLRENNIGPDSIVGLLMEKSFELIAGMLGILKAGGAYLPLDVTYPQDRIDYILEDSQIETVLTASRHAEILDGKDLISIYSEQIENSGRVANLDHVNSPKDLCYIIYTSGTTGKPKGVMIEHGNLVRLLFNDDFQFSFSEKDVWTMFHSHCFDFSVWEMYGALFYGAQVVIVSPLEAGNPSKFVEILANNKVSVLNQTPSSFYELVTESVAKNIVLKDLKYVIFGGEALTPGKLKSWREDHPHVKLINMYGITETTVHVTYKEIGADEVENHVSNIGKPIPTNVMYLLDCDGNIVPEGIVGEIYVGGKGVTRGYLNKEELTADRFVPNPFRKGEKMYRSGDLARLLKNGELEYLGRVDNQVQLNGFRVELGEIEFHLGQHRAISNAVVVLKEFEDERAYLCAYFTSSEELVINDIRSYLGKLVPYYMIPSYFVKLEEIPLTANNKVNLSKLPELKSYSSDNAYIAPSTAQEILVAQIWEAVLETKKVGIKDDFFSLGGDSIKAIKIISNINQELNASLVIADIYSSPTIEGLTLRLDSENTEENQQLYDETLAELELFQETYKANNDLPEHFEEVYPMNGIEMGMVFYSLKDHEETEEAKETTYHEQCLWDLPYKGFDFELFKKTVELITDKNAAFRKIYDLENFAHIILKKIKPTIELVDITDLDKEAQDNYILNEQHKRRHRNSDMSFSLIWEMLIIKISDSYQYLLFDFHHSMLDGWSLQTFMTDLNNIYLKLEEDSTYVPTPLQCSYKDQIFWELCESKKEANTTYWKQELEGYARFELPSTGLEDERVLVGLDLGLDYRKKLEKIAKKHDTSVKHLCFAAYTYLLRLYSYSNDIVSGMVTNNRPLVPDSDKLMGCFLNTVPCRINMPEGLTWSAYIDFVEAKLKKLKYHERIPFNKILDITGERTTEGNPIFDVSFNYVNFWVVDEMESTGQEILENDIDADKNFMIDNIPFALHVNDYFHSFKFYFFYSTAVFTEAYGTQLTNQIKRILDQFIDNPTGVLESTSLLAEEQQLQSQLQEFNDTNVSYTENDSILDLFREQVAKTPNAQAVVINDQQLTYSELDKKSNQLAHTLVAAGVGPETLVPLCIDRSFEMILGILGILKAGGAYVPIDPNLPEDRVSYIIEDTNASLILTQETYADRFELTKIVLDSDTNYLTNSESPVAVKIQPTSLAYVIYTSGSTGKPKGAMIEHAGIYNRLCWMRDYFNVTGKDTILQKTNFSFDVSVWELLLPFLCGSKLVFAKPEGHKDTAYLKELINAQGVTLMHFVPSMLTVFLHDINKGEVSGLRAVVCSGEELPAYAVKQFQDKCPQVRLYNLYGPTEASIDVTAIDVTDFEEGKVSIGHPVANTQIYIVNSENNIQPIGVKGELLIGGVQVARGYVNNELLTAEKFIENPFDKNDSYKVYKTGDLAKWLPDGSIEYLGRNDHQVKLRGFRIELGEITARLEAIPAVRQALVMAFGTGDSKKLVAYLCGDEPLETAEIKTVLSEGLPEYMIPAAYVWLDSFPLTPNGKLDRKALPNPDLTLGEEYIAPENDQQRMLVSIWSEVLGIEEGKISVTSDFFNLGGHSLTAIALMNRISKTFSVNLSLRELFVHRTIAQLADYIQHSELEAFVTIPSLAAQTNYPLSSAQKRMYFLYAFDKGGTTYNMPSFLRLEGTLDIQLLEQSFQQLMERHESLRTIFEIENGVPVQRILDSSMFVMQRSKAEAGDIAAYMNAFVQPFNLAKEYPIRVSLLEISGEAPLLLMDMHHIINDGISQEILIREFWSLYHGHELPELGMQYKDYAVWQQSDEHQAMVASHKSYWLARYSEEVKALELPTDRSRTIDLKDEGAIRLVHLSKTKSDKLRALAVSEGVTMYTMLLAIYNVLLSKLANQDDIVVGTPTAGRHHADLEGLVGMFVNTLTLRNSPNPEMTFRDFLSSVQDATLSAFDHQLYQYEELVEALDLPRNIGRNPLFDVFYSYGQKFDEQELQDSDLQIKTLERTENIAKFDLSFDVIDSEEIHLALTYRTALFDAATIDRFADYLDTIIDRVIEDADQYLGKINIISEKERTRLLTEFNTTDVQYNLEHTVLDMFNERVINAPHAIALVFDDQKLSYADLNERSELWAAHLIASGVTTGSLVGLLMNRSIEMITAMLAIMKSGAAYLPIKPEQPMARISHMLEDCGVAVVVSNLEDSVNRVGENVQCLSPIALDQKDIVVDPFKLVGVSPESLAYVIYTSGSTGIPKGVLIAHEGLSNLILHQKALFDIKMDENILQFSPYYFDASVEQIWLALTTGATLVLIEEEMLLDPKMFTSYLNSSQVTHLDGTPSFLEKVQFDKLTTVRRVLSGGESCKPSLVAKIANKYPFYNVYGPTEATVTCTVQKVAFSNDLDTNVSIGRPIANMQVYILGEQMELLPQGVIGELCIGGKGLSPGYLKRPDLTSERFMANPFGTGRLYKTGDLARWNADGTIQYLGRNDHQVKIRGIRIELGEIETQLEKIPLVTQALVLAYGTDDTKKLVAYLCGDEQLESEKIKSLLAASLPGYMVPVAYVWLDHFPVTANGKVDRKSLPRPDLTLGEKYSAPRNAQQELLVSIWSEVLGIETGKISITSDFFGLGGHSLLAITLINKINAGFAVELPLRALFVHRTIAELSAYLENQEKVGFISIPKAAESTYAPLSAAQNRMYFLYEYDKGSTSYNMPSFLRLGGNLDVDRLEWVFSELSTRHESLRTVFELVDGLPMQRVLEAGSFQMTHFKGEASSINDHIEAFVRPFNLATELPVRVALLEVFGEDALLMMDMHHIVNDGVSQEVLMREFWSLYHGYELQPLRIQYRDYAIWQQSKAHQELVAEHKSYWLNTYAEELNLLEIPTDYPRPLERSNVGEVHMIHIGKEQSDRLRSLAVSEGVTMYTMFLAIYNILLSKITNQKDIVIGTPTAGRNHADLEGLVGMFVNTLALRNQVAPNMLFRDFLAKVQEDTLLAFEHQLYQYEELVDALELSRDTSRNPLFDVFFSYGKASGELDGGTSDLTINAHEVPYKVAKFDLSLAVHDSEEISLSFTYRTDLFRQETIQRFSNYLNRIIGIVLEVGERELGAIELLSEIEKNCLLSEFNNTAQNYDLDSTVLDMFKERVLSTPDAVAVVFGKESLTYEALDKRSEQWASCLVDQGVEPGAIVGLLTTRSTEMITGILAIMKSGAAYLPINPDQPLSRTDHMLEECDSSFLVTNIEELANEFGQRYRSLTSQELDGYQVSGETKLPMASPERLAYVIYTSGSTGVPKGVLIEHKGLTNLNSFQSAYFEITAKDKVLQFSPYYFDASVEQIWLALTTGATLTLVGKETLLDTTAFVQYLSKNEITYMHCTPSFLENLPVDEVPSLRIVISGGEECKPSLANRFVGKTRFINEYGPTEGTVVATAHEVLSAIDEDVSIPIGKPIANVTTYILDEQMKLLPLGTPGELYIGGEGLSPGYLKRPDLTAERFITNPFGEGRLYKTGDMARWKEHGVIEYLGRNDYQVKIRGYRIELGEITAQLEKIEEVRQALVVAHGTDSNKRLIAYLAGEETLEAANIKSVLAGVLPDYMIPSGYVCLERFPVTPNGKIDRKALPSPDDILGEEYVAPQNAQQEVLVSIWAEVLGIDEEKVGIASDFFGLGGHSLLAITMANKINESFSVELPLRELFVHRTIMELSEFISGLEKVSFVSIPKAPESTYYPLSSAQNRMYFLYEFDKKSIAYNIPCFLRFEGALDIDKLVWVYKEFSVRHESLRTVFELVDGLPMQRVLEAGSSVVERRVIKASEIDAEVAAFVRPFDLANELPMRVSVLEIVDEATILMVDIHHIANDGVSQEMLMSEFWSLYNDHQLPELRIQYKDYASWQQSKAHQTLVASNKKFWLDQFADELSPLELPTDYPRPLERGNQGAVHSIQINKAQSDKLRSLAASEGVTMYTMFLAIYNLLLSKLSNQEDIVVGTPTAGRHHVDIEDMVGMFVNTLALRNSIDSNANFNDFLAQIQQDTLMAFDHQLYQYEELVDALELSRDTSRNPLFDVFFSYNQKTGNTDYVNEELLVRSHEVVNNVAKFDLELDVIDQGETFEVLFNYSLSLFKENTIQNFAAFFEKIMAGVLLDKRMKLSEIEILSKNEKNQIINEFNRPNKIRNTEETVVGLMALQVEKNPLAPALYFQEEMLDYGTLECRSNQLANYLIREKNVKVGDRIGLYLDRSPEMVIGFLAVLKCGGTYVSLDPTNPVQRIEMLIEDAAMQFVLTDSKSRLATIDSSVEMVAIENTSSILEMPKTAPKIALKGTDPAYIIYTSGTTGRPKGVIIDHAAMVDYSITFGEYFGLTSSDRVIQQASPSFDTVVEEVFPALVSGASIVVMKEGGKDIDLLVEGIKQTKATVLSTVPIVLSALNNYADQLNSLRVIVSGGDLLLPMHIDKLIDKYPLYNTYGPSESTVCVTYHKITSLDNVSCIGKPITNRQVYILNKDAQLCPVGVVGELCVSGKGLATGYLNDDVLTNTKFVENPVIPGSRIYRTGDAARWNPDGTIAFMGRIDDQIKIRGVRIELGEVISQLEEIEAVQQALVLADGPFDNRQLVAYLLGDSLLEGAEIKSILADKLPNYMIPTNYMWLDSFPLSTSGKINRKALPSLELTLDVEYVAPDTDMEKQLVTIWSDILSIEKTKISVIADFFSLGGHSLLAMQLKHQIKRSFEIELPLFEIFLTPTVRSIAEKINEWETKGQEDAIIVPLNKNEAKDKLFVIHDGSGEVDGYLELTTKIDGYECYGVKFGQFEDIASAPEVKEIASMYINEIKTIQSTGPYNLLGWSLGGEIASEMTAQLERNGEEVENLVLVDTFFNEEEPTNKVVFDIATEVALTNAKLGYSFENPESLTSLGEAWTQFLTSEFLENLAIDKVRNVLPEGIRLLIPDFENKTSEELLKAANKIRLLTASSENHFTADLVEARTLYVCPTESEAKHNSAKLEKRFGNLRLQHASGDHFSIMRNPEVRELASLINKHLNMKIPQNELEWAQK